MKRFKKSFIIVAIVILVTLISAYVINAATDYNFDDPTKIVGIEWVDDDRVYTRKIFDLDEVDEVEVIQLHEGTNENADAILNQPNVYCVQPGKEITSGTYSVSEEYEVKDPQLAYILAKGDLSGQGELEADWKDEWQIALWYYLTDTNVQSEDKEIILENINVNKALVVLADKNLNVQASAKNIPNIKTALVNTINTYDILKYDMFVVTKEAVAKIEEVYA